MGFDFVLVVFVFRGRIDHDASSRLGITTVVDHEHGADDQFEPDVSVVGNRSKAPRVRAPKARFESVDPFHGANFRAARYAPARQHRLEQSGEIDSFFQVSPNRRNKVVQMGVAFHFPEPFDGNGSGFADCRKVVPLQVDEHIVLGNLLGVIEKGLDDRTVRRTGLSLVGASDWGVSLYGLLSVRLPFRGTAQDGKVFRPEQKGFGGGVGQAKPLESQDRVDLSLGLESLGNLDLIGFAVEYGLAGLPEDAFVLAELKVATNGVAWPEVRWAGRLSLFLE